MNRLALLSSAAMMVMTSACAVGPDFHKPASPQEKGYTQGDMPEKTSSAQGNMVGASQKLEAGKAIDAQWWKQFGSEPLNALVKQALQNNPDIMAAKAALTQAQEAMLSERGYLLPQVDANFSPMRKLNNLAQAGQNGSSLFNLYNASVGVSYAVDVFGVTRREIEALQAAIDIQQAELEATYLTLTSNLINAAVQEASLREQIKETKDIIGVQSEQSQLLDKQFTLGAIPKSSLLEQQALVAQTETTLPPLEKQLAQKRHQLAALAGRFPSQGVEQTFALEALSLPENLPVSLPSQLVQQRPDIRAAEAQLHAATAEVGVATAAMLPRISLSASYGVSSTEYHSLFTPDSLAWNLGGNILQPIFRGGELLHAKRGKEAAFERARAQYQGVVLQAFQNVADVLRALQYDADALASEVRAEHAAADSLKLSRQQYEVGAIAYSQMLDAQRTWQQSRIRLVQAEASRLTDTVALYQALGGGWWANTPEGAEAPAAKEQPKDLSPIALAPAPAPGSVPAAAVKVAPVAKVKVAPAKKPAAPKQDPKAPVASDEQPHSLIIEEKKP